VAKADGIFKYTEMKRVMTGNFPGVAPR